MTASTETVSIAQKPQTKTSLLQLLAGLFTFLVMCPYLAPIPLGTDTQPYAALAAVAVIASAGASGRRIRTTRGFIALSFVTIYSIVISVILQSFFFRGIIGYASLVAIGWASYLIFRHELFSVKVFERVVLLWFFVGLIQLTVYPEFAYQLMTHARTTDTRGVVGLAPEPSYYGITGVFFFLIFQLLASRGYMNIKRARIFQVISIVQLAFLAQSATAILMMILYYIIYCISLRQWKQLALLVVGIIVGGFILTSGITNARVAVLVQMLIRNPALLPSTDVSVGDRVGSIWLCFWGFIKDFPASIFGHGTNTWTDFVNVNVPLFPQVCSQVTPGRILSGFGSGIFEIGVVGLVIPYLLIKSLSRHGDRSLTAMAIFVTVVMFAAIPLAFPLYSFLFGFSESFPLESAKQVHDTSNASLLEPIVDPV